MLQHLKGLVLGIAMAITASAAVAERPMIAVVIDDLGYQPIADRRVLELDQRVTVAIIPDAPLSGKLAREAAAQQREVLIHLPLPALVNNDCRRHLQCPQPEWTPVQMAAHLRRAMRQVESAAGINNHQGSLFTADAQAVGSLAAGVALLNRLYGTSMFVLDSRTTPGSQLEQKARQVGLAAARRHVFLDHVIDEHAIGQAFDQLLEIAHGRGGAIAIGHPHPETIEFLTSALPLLEEQGVELVPVSRLVRFRARESLPVPAAIVP